MPYILTSDASQFHQRRRSTFDKFLAKFRVTLCNCMRLSSIHKPLWWKPNVSPITLERGYFESYFLGINNTRGSEKIFSNVMTKSLKRLAPLLFHHWRAWNKKWCIKVNSIRSLYIPIYIRLLIREQRHDAWEKYSSQKIRYFQSI